MNKRIQSLFRARDEAVLSNDKKLFLSTQIKEIDGSSSKGYLDIERMKSTILHVHEDEFEKNVWIVLVREDFFKSNKLTHHGYLIYTVVKRKEEFIISNIRW
ncbi:hypothetical protein KKE78_04465 [Patescibacteria group bacterium]|nr:hypothetical protein [Patescibacteria group bacterium]